MLKDDLFDLALVLAVHIVAVRLFDCKAFAEEPILAVHIALLRVNVNRLVVLVCVEEHAPAVDEEDGGHELLFSLITALLIVFLTSFVLHQLKKGEVLIET